MFYQWLVGTHHATTYVGCIGHDDNFGKIMTKKAQEDGVNVQYQYTDKEPSGTCGVLVTDQCR